MDGLQDEQESAPDSPGAADPPLSPESPDEQDTFAAAGGQAAAADDRLARLRNISVSLGQAVTLEGVADSIIAGVRWVLGADAGSVAIRIDGDRMRTIRCFGYPPEIVARYREYPAATSLPNADACRSGTALFVETAAERAVLYPHLVRSHTRPRGALVALPLAIDGAAFGGLAFSFPTDRAFTPGDREFLQTVATLCSQALQRAQLYDAAQHELAERRRIERELAAANLRLKRALDREHAIAATLQRSLLLVAREGSFPGLEVRTRYSPAGNDLQVGGDFVNVFPLPGGRIALAVGDVSGKGLFAAARTAEVQYAMRAYLTEFTAPAVAMTRLNHYLIRMLQLEGGYFESGFICLALAVVDPERGIATFCLAGAEPPAIMRADGGAELVPASGPPLVVSESPDYTETTALLAPGDLIAIVTDGITEARSHGALFGLEGLIATASERHGRRSLSATADAILTAARTFAGGSLRDDACVLVARRS